ncbi:MAG: hypothetical protein AB7F39_03710 [Variibacter sp.]
MSAGGVIVRSDELRNSRLDRLPYGVVHALLNGRHGAVGGKSHRERGQNLARIAAAYTREELLDEHGIGPRTADFIEGWLHSQGFSLRCSEKGVEDARAEGV